MEGEAGLLGGAALLLLVILRWWCFGAAFLLLVLSLVCRRCSFLDTLLVGGALFRSSSRICATILVEKIILVFIKFQSFYRVARLALGLLNFEQPFSLCFRHPDSIFPGNSRMKN